MNQKISNEFLDNEFLGEKGELLARVYLRRLGYKIIGQNVRIGKSEIDIIAKHKNVLVFIEVKTRSSDRFGRPEESITSKKIYNLSRAMSVYLKKHPEEKEARIDVISIMDKPSDPRPKLKHFKSVGENGLAIF